MLAIQRDVGETLIIAGIVKIQVVRFKGGGVVLGIEAPLDIQVDREEIHLAKLRDAANGNP